MAGILGVKLGRSPAVKVLSSLLLWSVIDGGGIASIVVAQGRADQDHSLETELTDSRLETLEQQRQRVTSCSKVLEANVGEGDSSREETWTVAERQGRLVTVKVWAGAAGNWGSGIVLGYRYGGYLVLTNDHVLALGEGYQVETVDGGVHSAARVTAVDFGTYDLGLVWFPGTEGQYPVAQLRSPSEGDDANGQTEPLVVGQRVTAAGFPFDFSTGTSLTAIAKRAGAEAARQCGDGLWTLGGRVSRWLERSLSRGYRLGYTNWVAKGMSGGPLLDEAGYVVAVNGRQAYPAFGKVHVLEDGSSPDPLEDATLVRSSWGIPIEVPLGIMARQGWSIGVDQSTGADLEDGLGRVKRQRYLLPLTLAVPGFSGLWSSGWDISANDETTLLMAGEVTGGSLWEVLGWQPEDTVASAEDEVRVQQEWQHLRSIVSVSVGESLFLGVLTGREPLDTGGWRYTVLIPSSSSTLSPRTESQDSEEKSVWVRSPDGKLQQGIEVRSETVVIAVQFDSPITYHGASGRLLNYEALAESSGQDKSRWAALPILWDDTESFSNAPPVAQFLPTLLNADWQWQHSSSRSLSGGQKTRFYGQFIPHREILPSRWFPWGLVRMVRHRGITTTFATNYLKPDKLSREHSPLIRVPFPLFQDHQWLGWAAPVLENAAAVRAESFP
ncbi:MAG: serine protease [Cyanobacteria bacterium P01_C01_bin.89]